MSAPDFWNPQSEQDRAAMRDLLVPLIIASRSRDFVDRSMARAQLHAWCLSMRDVPRAIVAEAFDRIVAGGVTWMPKPGEVKKICAAIILEKRAQARRGALEKCQHPNHWIEITAHGVTRMKRCACWERGEKLALAVAQPLALPESTGLAPLDDLAPIVVEGVE